ncbi:MAG TPA: aminoglycoside phosphotransferase family protein [Novosphingobium sp.]|nr:aminoglycoside phosphotransferase family protein [Novosphingobium sp.]
MVDAAFPQWAELALTRVEGFGTDHQLFRLGRDMVVRIPARSEAASQIHQHAEWLDRFAVLPLAVPRILGLGHPGPDCPYPWCVASWIDGRDAADSGVTEWDHAASALGRFLAELRALDTAGGQASGPANAWRGAPLRKVDSWMRQAIAALDGLADPARLTRLWDEALAVPEWTGAPVWVHGDLHGANILVRGGRVAGVIDFGLVSIGDPACDLAPAWTFLPAAQRETFLQATGLDSAARQRGKGWALYAGAIALAHHRSGNPVLSAMGSRALAAVLDS